MCGYLCVHTCLHVCGRQCTYASSCGGLKLMSGISHTHFLTLLHLKGSCHFFLCLEISIYILLIIFWISFHFMYVFSIIWQNNVGLETNLQWLKMLCLIWLTCWIVIKVRVICLPLCLSIVNNFSRIIRAWMFTKYQQGKPGKNFYKGITKLSLFSLTKA